MSEHTCETVPGLLFLSRPNTSKHINDARLKSWNKTVSEHSGVIVSDYLPPGTTKHINSLQGWLVLESMCNHS